MKIEKFLQSRGYYLQSKQTVHRMRDNLYQLHFRQRSNIQKSHKVKKLNSKGTKLPTNKWADEPNLEFL